MKKVICGAGVVALLVAVAAASRPAGATTEETPTIKDVMKQLHKGANSPLAKLKGQLKAATPDWKAIQDETKDFVILGAALSKNDPPQGEKASWTKLSDAYFADAKALDDAAKKQDKAGAQAAFNRLSGSCKSCHQAHKGQ